MSDEPDRLDPRDELDLQAAEYVLGCLPRNQARALEALALNDPSVAASIVAWEKRFAPLTDLVDLRPPPPVVWRRLALATGIDSVVQPAPLPRRRTTGLWHNVGLWRATTAGALAVAACLVLLVSTRPAARPEGLVAALSPYGAPGATFLVRVGADGAAVVIAVGATDVPQGRSLELWAVTGNNAPVSMGLLPASGRARLTMATQADTQLLVSQEPVGGSPTKAPTGPVVYQGKLTRF